MTMVLLALITAAFVWSLIWNCKRWKELRKRREKEYRVKYHRVQRLIRICDSSELSKQHIICLLRHMERLKYKNREMSSVLWSNYIRKFYGTGKIQKI